MQKFGFACHSEHIRGPLRFNPFHAEATHVQSDLKKIPENKQTKSSTSLSILPFLLSSCFFTFPSSLFLFCLWYFLPSFKLYQPLAACQCLSAFEDAVSVHETGQDGRCSLSKLSVMGAKKQNFSYLSGPHKWSHEDQGQEKALAHFILGCRTGHTVKAGLDLVCIQFLAHTTPFSNPCPQDLKFFSPCHFLFLASALGRTWVQQQLPTWEVTGETQQVLPSQETGKLWTKRGSSVAIGSSATSQLSVTSDATNSLSLSPAAQAVVGCC